MESHQQTLNAKRFLHKLKFKILSNSTITDSERDISKVFLSRLKSQSNNFSQELTEEIRNIDRLLSNIQTPIHCPNPIPQIFQEKTTQIYPNKSQTSAVSKSPATATTSPETTTSADRIQHLMQKQKNINTKELEAEQRVHNKLTEELVEITSMLKESTEKIHLTVKEQNLNLDSMQVQVSDNKQALDEQRKQMSDRSSSMSRSLWEGLWVLGVALGLFALTYIVIRLFPSPPSYLPSTFPVPSSVSSFSSLSSPSFSSSASSSLKNEF